MKGEFKTGRSNGSHLHFEHIDKEGTEQIKKWVKQGKLGLNGEVHRVNPHDSLKEIGGQSSGILNQKKPNLVMIALKETDKFTHMDKI